MHTYISLLRGINVSGQKKINMKELQAAYEDAGFTHVQTYIQSGNVVFQSVKKSSANIQKQVETFIEKHFGFDVSVVVLTPEELHEAIAGNPFAQEKDFEEKKMYLCFLSETPKAEFLEKIKDAKYESDRFMIKDKIIYLYVPSGYGNTKLNNNFFENKLKRRATTRNWNSVKKLAEMAGANQH